MKNIFTYIIAYCMLVCSTQIVFATSYSWTGSGGDTRWNRSTNWSPNGIPTTGDTVTIASGAATHQPGLDTIRAIGQFTMSSGTLNLSTWTLSVMGKATLSGGTIQGTATDALQLRGSYAVFSGTTFDVQVNVQCGYIQLNGSTFNKVSWLEMTGSTDGLGNGGNTFIKKVTLRNNSSASFRIAEVSANTFSDTVIFINSGSREFRVCDKGKTAFNGNIYVNSTSGPVNFGSSGGDTATLASGKIIAVGSTGFSSGTLLFQRFIQTGSTAQTVTLTGSAIFNTINSIFNGKLTISSPSVLVKETKFYDTLSVTQKGGTNSASSGGNLFDKKTTITNHGSANLQLAVDAGDTFNGDVVFVTDSTGYLYPCYSDTNYVKGNLTATGSNISFKYGTGVVRFSGNVNQSVNGNYAIQFLDLSLKKTSGIITLNTEINVYGILQFIKGVIVSDTTNLLTMAQGSSVSGASDTSFVSGPVRKSGNAVFVFPTGKEDQYRPIEISAPSNSTDAFVAEFINDSVCVHTNDMDSTLGYVVRHKYWKLNRTGGTSQVYVTLTWNQYNHINDTSKIYVTGWNNVKWKDYGRSVAIVSGNNGTIKSAVSINTFNEFSFGYGVASVTACTGSTIVQPVAYYTFDEANKHSASPAYSGQPAGPTLTPTTAIPSSQTNGLGWYLNNTSLTAGPFTAGMVGSLVNNIIGVEFIAKLNQDFINEREIQFFSFAGQSFRGGIQYPEIYFHINFPTGEHRFTVLLDGTGPQSLEYYLDNNWHHFFFLCNANTSLTSPYAQIWVDGTLYDDFEDPLPVADAFSFANDFEILPASTDYKFVGQMDNIAVYLDEVCPEQIYSNYHTILPSGPATTPSTGYCFNPGSCTLSAGPSGGDLHDDYDINEFPLNYDLNEPDPLLAADGCDMVIDQYQSYPLPRYLPGNTLLKNYNVLQSDWLGRGGKQAKVDAVPASLEIQKELARYWNYHFNVIENTLALQNVPCQGLDCPEYNTEWLSFADANTTENFTYAVSSNRVQMSPVHAGFTTPGNHPYITIYDDSFLPATNYISDKEDAADQSFLYFDNVCTGIATSSTPLLWSPAGDQSLYVNDGLTQKHYIDRLYIDLGFSKPLSLMVEDDESHPDYQYDGQVPCAAGSADLCIDGFNNSGILPWALYMSNQNKLLKREYYRDQFLNPSLTYWDKLKNTMFNIYANDGHPNPQFRFQWDSMRVVHTVYSKDANGDNHYLSTPDFYLFKPSHWFSESAASGNSCLEHGWRWIAKSRRAEIAFGDTRTSPFVAAGWGTDDKEHVRPGQWLGLLKCVGLTGVEFFLPGHFQSQIATGGCNDSPDAKGWCWQAAPPSYAQAILSRCEDFLKDGILMDGDVNVNFNEPQKAYRFITGSMEDLVACRQMTVSGVKVNKFVIGGATQSLGNQQYIGEHARNVKISLPQHPSGNVNLQFNIRKQGSTYIFDNSNTSAQVFYQLDKWHEYKDPQWWSTDFDFEAEVFDNKNDKAVIETEEVSPAAPHTRISDGDFRSYASYVAFAANPGENSLDYYFQPRNSTANNDYDFWVLARCKTDTKLTGMKVFLLASDGSGSVFENSVGCITDADDWQWYHVDACGVDITYLNLVEDKQYKLSIFPMNDYLEIDRIYLLKQGNTLPFTPGTQASCTPNTTYNGSTLSSDVTKNNKTISIIGLLTLNANLTLNNCIVKMGADASIQVNYPYTLTINRTNISSTCGNMWDMIDNSGNVVVETSSVISDSKNGLVNNPSSTFDLRNSTFDKNYYDVKLINDDFSSSGQITGCTFKCSDGKIIKGPSGFTGKQTYRHIYLENVTDFTLGASGPSNVNTIQNATTGVYVNYTSGYSAGISNIEITNNNFEREVTPYNYSATSKALVCSTAVAQGMQVNNVDVNHNTFTDWTYGIQPTLMKIVDESDNDFEKVTYGILNTSCRLMSVLSNDFVKCLKPIKCYNTVFNGNVADGLEISSNNINVGLPYNKDDYSDEGIRVDILTSPSLATEIHNNKIYNCRIGIHGKEANFLNISDNGGANEYHTEIPKEDLDEYPSSQPHYGVWLESCNYSDIQGCDISWTSSDYASSDELGLLRGISITTSKYGTVAENLITNMGAGIRLVSNCNYKSLKCNSMVDCYDGVFLSSAKIRNQGIYTGSTSSTAWNNLWDNPNTTVNFRVDGSTTGVLPHWMFNNDDDNDDPSYPIITANIIDPFKCNNTDDCDPPSSIMDCNEFAQYFYPIINDTLDYPSDDSIYIYNKFVDYYETINEDTTLLYDCTSGGSRYRTVYDSLKTTNIGMFKAALDSIKNENLSAALANLDTMVTENTIEFNLWYSLRAFLNYYSQGLEPDSAVIDSLIAISIQDLFHGGKGVHVAQGLLHYDQEDEEESPRLAKPNVPEEKDTFKPMPSITFYPNPATNEVNAVINGKFGSHSTLQLFNSLNQLCAKYSLPEGAFQFKFSINSLQQGIYNCQIIDETKISVKTKMMIIK